jgi:hypothetical protein
MRSDVDLTLASGDADHIAFKSETYTSGQNTSTCSFYFYFLLLLRYSLFGILHFFFFYQAKPAIKEKGGSRPGGLRFHQLHQLKTIFGYAWGILSF